MYSPAERPSSTRAAPAKNRIWSTIGGISSDRVRRDRLAGVLALDLDQLVGALLDGVRDRSSAFCRSEGVVSRQPLERGRGGGACAASTSACPDSGRGARRRLAGARVDDVGGAPVGGVHLLAVHEVAQRALVGLGRLHGTSSAVS